MHHNVVDAKATLSVLPCTVYCMQNNLVKQYVRRDGFGLGPRPVARGPDRFFESPARPEPDFLSPTSPRAEIGLQNYPILAKKEENLTFFPLKNNFFSTFFQPEPGPARLFRARARPGPTFKSPARPEPEKKPARPIPNCSACCFLTSVSFAHPVLPTLFCPPFACDIE